MNKIYKDSETPLYMQLFNVLLQKIETSLSPGDRLDSELEICKKYGVSRTTVRQALQKLEQEEYIYRIHGSGHFVAESPACRDISSVLSCEGEHPLQEDATMTSRLLSFTQIQASGRLATRFQVKDGSQMFKRVRLQAQGGVPLLYETAYLPVERFHGLEANLLSDLPLTEILEKNCAARITGATRYFQPVLVGREASVHLQLAPKLPALQIEQFLYEDDKLLTYILGITRGDKFKYHCALGSEYTHILG